MRTRLSCGAALQFGWFVNFTPPLTTQLTFCQFAEYSNFLTHLNLRSIRPEGSRKRSIPYGYGFNWVSLPNYFFEILGWVVFTIMTGSWASKEPFPPLTMRIY